MLELVLVALAGGAIYVGYVYVEKSFSEIAQREVDKALKILNKKNLTSNVCSCGKRKKK